MSTTKTSIPVCKHCCAATFTGIRLKFSGVDAFILCQGCFELQISLNPIRSKLIPNFFENKVLTSMLCLN